MIKLVQFEGSNVSPYEDARLYRMMLGDGFFRSCTVSRVSATQIDIGPTWGFMCGRQFWLDKTRLTAVRPGSGSANYAIVVHIDITNAANPITLVCQLRSTALTQEDINDSGSVYEMQLGGYTATSSDISDVAVLAPRLFYRGFRGYSERIVSVGTGNAINVGEASIFKVTAGGQTLALNWDTTFGNAGSTNAYSVSVTLVVTGGASGLNFPSSVVWAAGKPPFSAGTVTEVVLRTYNGGTTWYGSEGGTF